ncbi:hypothetical protein VNO80_10181 [Phaseolus coccineus]|uniref:Secreted protein n=1 Tax=Phaseolus coccineus TaxID=3886 RepID=A0AAN9NCY1_PHACN
MRMFLLGGSMPRALNGQTCILLIATLFLGTHEHGDTSGGTVLSDAVYATNPNRPSNPCSSQQSVNHPPKDDSRFAM